MQKLLSLPPHLVDCFYDIENVDQKEWYCASDPIGKKVGSGGGTTWLLERCHETFSPEEDFEDWLSQEKRILFHAGGQSRRLPSYAPTGKILTPIPVFRWARGQKLSQNLLSLQLPLYEQIMEKVPSNIHTLIASGDVYIRTSQSLPAIPEADVVCFGLWVDPLLAKNHGVFVSERSNPEQLDYMLQKPSVATLKELMQTHLFMMDIGIWMLSDKAVKVLCEKSKKEGEVTYYDLYSQFGLGLGNSPKIEDAECNDLTVAIVPLPGGEFYHYGTSRELISSTLAVQNIVNDQREIMHHSIKPHPAMFVQNCILNQKLKAENSEVWIENSYVPESWTLHHKHVITGVPKNSWAINLPAEVCLDIVPIGESEYVVRPYGFNDAFRGDLADEQTLWMGIPVLKWIKERALSSTTDWGKSADLQTAKLFPICRSMEDIRDVLAWMLDASVVNKGKEIWESALRLSAEEISAQANLVRLVKQREDFCSSNWATLMENNEKSVFYQLDLSDAAQEFVKKEIPLAPELSEKSNILKRINDKMFRAKVAELSGRSFKTDYDEAFNLLREELKRDVLNHKIVPACSVYEDQIVWSRSPVRIDLAGGWTDTAPFCLNSGGRVVNLSVELNGQPPLQVFVKPTKSFHIVLRSIDMGAMETIKEYQDLTSFNAIGSPFSIPKAALVLSGFSPLLSAMKATTLSEQLKAFGCGLEVTLLSAIPAGSGLGTSSILASTVLAALSDFCGLGWDNDEICQRTIVLEQLLTTGGGWQDQYGGVIYGVKMLETQKGFNQSPVIRWLPNHLFTDSAYKDCHLLYYTGITRVAKNILAEIVQGMFLNSSQHLAILQEMKEHTSQLYDAIQLGHFEKMAHLVGRTWEQNKRLDSGTNPPQVEAIIDKIKDYCLGYKLPGAGGGGYMYMIAKNPECAARIRTILTTNPLNNKARFVDMSLSEVGLRVSRS